MHEPSSSEMSPSSAYHSRGDNKPRRSPPPLVSMDGTRRDSLVGLQRLVYSSQIFTHSRTSHEDTRPVANIGDNVVEVKPGSFFGLCVMIFKYHWISLNVIECLLRIFISYSKALKHITNASYKIFEIKLFHLRRTKNDITRFWNKFFRDKKPFAANELNWEALISKKFFVCALLPLFIKLFNDSWFVASMKSSLTF